MSTSFVRFSQDQILIFCLENRKKEYQPPSTHQQHQIRKNLISLQLKVFFMSEEMLSVTNQTVRTLQRDNSNKFDSQQSEGSGQASWHHMIISQNFPRTEMDFHQTNWHFKHVDAQNLQGQTKTTLRKTLYSVSVVARRQPPLQ